MAMICHEEPLCPSSPLFKPCRFLLQEDFFPSFLPGQIDVDGGLSFDFATAFQGSIDEVNKRNKRSILSFLNNKARKNGDEKNQLK